MIKDILLKCFKLLVLTLIYCYIAHKFNSWNTIIIYLLVLNFVESKGE